MHKHTVTCLQAPPHCGAQGTHFWGALHLRDDVTDKVEGFVCALPQVEV